METFRELIQTAIKHPATAAAATAWCAILIDFVPRLIGGIF